MINHVDKVARIMPIWPRQNHAKSAWTPLKPAENLALSSLGNPSNQGKFGVEKINMKPIISHG